MSKQPRKDGAVLVDTTYFWIPIHEVAPMSSSKIQLINKEAGCASYGTLASAPGFWTHWAPLPKFRDDESSYLGVSSKTPKADVLVNSGALMLALNSLKRGTQSQREIAEELEKTVVNIKNTALF